MQFFLQSRKKVFTKQSFGHIQLNNLNSKKAAKKIIKLAKEHPGWYTKEDVRFAKMVKKRLKQEKLAKKNEAKDPKGVQ